MKTQIKSALALALLLSLAAPVAAEEGTHRGYEYDPLRAGHPLRIAAYVLHPVGVTLDYLIFRPAWWVGQREPWRTLFGVQLPPREEAPISD
jgi:hypothetical protein